MKVRRDVLHAAGVLRQRVRALTLRACLCVASLLSLAGARAQELPRLRIVNAGPPAIAERVRAELGTLGFDARVETRSESDRPLADGEELALWIRAASGHTEVLLLRPAQREPEVYQLSPETGASDATRAIQLVELVRPSLLAATAHGTEPAATDAAARDAPEASTSPARQPDPLDFELPPAVDVPPARRPPPPPAQYSAELGLGVLGGNSMTAAPVLSAALGTFVDQALRVELFSLVPLQRMVAERGPDQTFVRATFLGADVRLDVLHAASFQLSAALGAAASFIATERFIADVVSPIEHTEVSGCFYLRTGAAYQFTHALALRAELLLGRYVNSPMIRVGARDVVEWGLPWLAGALAMETRFR